MEIIPFLILLLGLTSLASGEKIKHLQATFDPETGKVSISDPRIAKAGKDVSKLAWTSLKNDINETGWAILEVHTSSYALDSLQAYLAGRLEAQVTSDLIYYHFKNTIGDDFCSGDRKEFCSKLQDFLRQNLDFMNRMIDQNRKRDPFWHQVGLSLEQAAGLQDGYENPSKEIVPHRNISLFGLYLIALGGDLEDLEPVLKVPEEKRTRVLGSGSCSALIKLLPYNEDLLTSQVTWSDYSSMIRILKHYSLNYHLTHGSQTIIPGNDMSLSGYPGTIQSGDDFMSFHQV